MLKLALLRMVLRLVGWMRRRIRDEGWKGLLVLNRCLFWVDLHVKDDYGKMGAVSQLAFLVFFMGLLNSLNE
jgi:hypothetical protein